MNIVYFVSDGILEYNSSHFRVSLQADALQMADLADAKILNIQHWLKRTTESMVACAEADVIVIQRVMLAESIERALYWIERGKKVLVDFDDAYDLIGKENAAYPFWGEGLVDITDANGRTFQRKLIPHPVEQFKSGLSQITGSITPSSQLCKDWGVYNRSFRIENYLDSNRYHAAKRKKRNSRKISIGWGGSLSHLTSFSHSGVQKALQNVLSKYSNVELLIFGDERVVKQLPFKEKVRHIPYVMWRDWPKMLNLYDIGIAPLAGKYDARRSALKVKEYICMGIPFVATSGMPYLDIEESKKAKSGIFVNQRRERLTRHPKFTRLGRFAK
jgi:hypothetical protein